MREFGLPNLVRFPIAPELSAAGDGGRPVVVSDPAGPTAQQFLELGAAVPALRALQRELLLLVPQAAGLNPAAFRWGWVGERAGGQASD